MLCHLAFRYVGLSLCDIVFRNVVFYVIMWTNPSIISVTATLVGNCICQYQSEKSRDRNPKQDF